MTKSFADIFKELGGPAEVGRILGVTTEHAVQMRRRGSIPPDHWPALVIEAQRRGLVTITHEALLAARKGRRLLSPVEEGAAA